MTKVIFIAVAAAMLTGCVHTAKGLREQQPTIEAMSDKKPDAVLGCVTEAWEKRGMTTSYKPLSNGGSVTIDVPAVLIDYGTKLSVVDAEIVDGHTRVRLYGISMIGGKQKRLLLDDAKGCI